MHIIQVDVVRAMPTRRGVVQCGPCWQRAPQLVVGKVDRDRAKHFKLEEDWEKAVESIALEVKDLKSLLEQSQLLGDAAPNFVLIYGEAHERLQFAKRGGYDACQLVVRNLEIAERGQVADRGWQLSSEAVLVQEERQQALHA